MSDSAGFLYFAGQFRNVRGKMDNIWITSEKYFKRWKSAKRTVF